MEIARGYSDRALFRIYSIPLLSTLYSTQARLLKAGRRRDSMQILQILEGLTLDSPFRKEAKEDVRISSELLLRATLLNPASVP